MIGWRPPSLKAGGLGLLMGVIATISATPAFAQAPPPEPANPPLPRLSTDRNGINPATGQLSFAFGQVSTGGDAGDALGYQMEWEGTVLRDQTKAWIQQISGTYYVSIGEVTERFNSSFVSLDGAGSTLSYDSGNSRYIYTRSDGTEMTFLNAPPNNRYPEADIIALLDEIVRPDGLVTQYHYRTSATQNPFPPPLIVSASRVQSITNTLGYQLHFQYAGNAITISTTDPTVGAESIRDFYRITEVTAINNGVDYCNPTGTSCSGLTQNWPSVEFTYVDHSSGFPVQSITATDNLNRETTVELDNGGFRIDRIERPEAGDEPIVLTYTNNRVTQVDDGAGVWNYSYSTNGSNQVTQTVIDPPVGGNVTVAINTGVGLPSSVTNGTGDTTSYLYDSQGRMTRMTMPEGNYTQYTYDSRSNVTQVRRVASGESNITTSATYPSSCGDPRSCNLPTSTTDANGNTTTYVWKNRGQIESVTLPDPDGSGPLPAPQTRFFYAQRYARYKQSSSGGPTQAPDYIWRPLRTESCRTGASCTNNANEREVFFDFNHNTTGYTNLRLATQTERQGNGGDPITVGYTYDPFGNVLTQDGPYPGNTDTTYFRYNAGIQLAGVVAPDPDGSGVQERLARHFLYDANGNVTRIYRGVLASAGAAWSTLDRLNYTENAYDDVGRRIRSLLRADSGTILTRTEYSYDAASRPLCTAVRMGTLSGGFVDACTQRTATSFGPDRITRNIYDNANRLDRVQQGYGTADVATVVNYAFNDNGTVAVVADGNGNSTSYFYDGHDRLTQMRYPNPSGSGSSTTDREFYAWDDNGNLTTHTLRDGGTISYTYDKLNRRTLMNPSASNTPDVTYAYDNFGNMTSAVRSGFALSFGYDIHSRQITETGPFGTFTRQYREDGAMERLTWPDSAFFHFTYTRTGQRRYLYRNATSGGANIVNRINYDRFNRPDNWYGDAGSSATRAYQGFGFDALSRLDALDTSLAGTSADVDATFAYNPASQIATRSRDNGAYAYTPPASAEGTTSYTPNGLNQYSNVNPPGSGSITPAYDDRGNLTEYGADIFEYDQLNRLTRSTVEGVTVGYNYDPLGRLFFVNPPGSANDRRYVWESGRIATAYQGNTGTTIAERYVHEPGSLGAPQAIYTGSAVGLANQLYVLTDERGSVIALADGDGDPVAANTYGPFGEPGAGNEGAFGYAGQLMLPEAGLVYMRNRVYHPGLGRFMQTDPIGYDGGMNLYAYVGNDPINFTDPWGLEGPPGYGPPIDVEGRRPSTFFGSFRSFGGGGGGADRGEENLDALCRDNPELPRCSDSENDEAENEDPNLRQCLIDIARGAWEGLSEPLSIIGGMAAGAMAVNQTRTRTHTTDYGPRSDLPNRSLGHALWLGLKRFIPGYVVVSGAVAAGNAAAAYWNSPACRALEN